LPSGAGRYDRYLRPARVSIVGVEAGFEATAAEMRGVIAARSAAPTAGTVPGPATRVAGQGSVAAPTAAVAGNPAVVPAA
jgi:hypothetical protein